jgi:peptidase E
LRLQEVCKIPKDKVAWMLDGSKNYMTSERKRYVRAFIQFLQGQLDKEVCYIPIKSIDKLSYSGWMYNINLKNQNNYVIEGMLGASS